MAMSAYQLKVTSLQGNMAEFSGKTWTKRIGAMFAHWTLLNRNWATAQDVFYSEFFSFAFFKMIIWIGKSAVVEFLNSGGRPPHPPNRVSRQSKSIQFGLILSGDINCLKGTVSWDFLVLVSSSNIFDTLQSCN